MGVKGGGAQPRLLVLPTHPREKPWPGCPVAPLPSTSRASLSCYQLRGCLPAPGSLTASRMFDRQRQIRRLSTHLTEDVITPHSVCERVCVEEGECV